MVHVYWGERRKGAALDLPKGLWPSGLPFRDWVGDAITQRPRVYARIRVCGRDQRAMETDEVCGRPLDCFVPSCACWLV